MPTVIQTRIDTAITILGLLRDGPAASTQIEADNPHHLRLLHKLALDTATAVGSIFAVIAVEGRVNTASLYGREVYNMVHDDLAAELSVAAGEAAYMMDEGAEYERDDYAEHNTLFKAAQMGAR